MPTIYKVDHNRVFTGKTVEIGPKDPIFPNSIMTPPPETDGFAIWDGNKWFTRDEYPTPPQRVPPRVTKLTRLEFRNRFTTAEKVALENARETNAMVRVFFDDLAAAEYVDIEEEAVVEGVQYLESQGLIAEGRAAEILNG
ncbi:hypothetical protein [Vreelandella aquamarina]|uniref:hypothetical protein n=1 Tax=Vreelandella aquamarina TaxID=77097 RepID=UPI00384CDF1B